MRVIRPQPAAPIPLPGNFGQSIEVRVLSTSPNVPVPALATAIVWDGAAYVFDAGSYVFTPATDTVTIVQGGRYRFSWSLGLNADPVGGSSDNVSQLEQAGTPDPEGFALGSTEDFFTNTNSMERAITRNVTAGDAIRLLANQFASGGSNVMVSGQMSLHIERVL